VILSIQEFLKLKESLPAADVRSEGEYQQGHIPTAINIPILNNSERIAVGTDYKHKGQLEAIKTGFRLVGPRIIDIVNEAERVANAKELLVHCWRGGMRSSNFCHFVEMAKIKTHQLRGGYKAYRNEAIQSFSLPFQFNVVSGFTGSGKTEILQALEKTGEQIINLEKLASHKGSAFGGLNMNPQPTTEQFQNDLFESILKLDLNRRIWIEDESITIGKVVLPEPFWRRITESPVVQIDVAKNIRVERLVHEYGNLDRNEFLAAMRLISRKLGGQHFQAAAAKVEQGDMAGAIEILLVYYDKAYHSSLAKRKERVLMKTEWNGHDSDKFAASVAATVERA
jgi:tRNA 2-selenouridine synthase